MSHKTKISIATNTLASAYAILKGLGYQVTNISNTEGVLILIQAENDQFCFVAEDPLSLLGLIKLTECRGDFWAPTDLEAADFISFFYPHGYSEPLPKV